MIIIADCGGTKVTWCVLDHKGVVKEFTTPGMNVLMLSYEEMCHRLAEETSPQLGDLKKDISEVFFYGAGCASAALCESVGQAIRTILPDAKTEVASDMLASCRALCGSHGGVVCILGTGSNSCLYDGTKIVDNVSPLGFILGDEGSGANLGKILVSDVLKRQLPEHICKKFHDKYGLDTMTVINRVYREPYPNKFLASLTPFLSENIHEPSIHNLVIGAFRNFFRRNVALYAIPEEYGPKVYFSGSIAWYFRSVLAEAAALSGYSLANVLRDPIEGLIKYHLGQY